MKNPINYLAPLGFLIAILRLIFYFFVERPIPGKLEIYLIVGAVMILAHILLRWEAIVGAIGGRQMRYGGLMIVLVTIVVGILVVVNAIAAHRVVRWDLTKSKRFSLSDQTEKVVQGLKDDITITYFQRTGSGAEEGRDRLRDYQELSPKLKVEYVDPLTNPGRTQALDVHGPWPVIVVQKGDRRERITNDSEEDLTNALIKVTHSGKKAVCFEEGEGERDLDDSGETGFSAAKAALGKSLYETKKVTLVREKQVPGDCSVLVVAGPQKDLLPPVVDEIRTYVKGGGKAFLMVDPEIKESFPNLDGLLQEWNVETKKDVIVDESPIGQLVGAGAYTPVVTDYSYHEITKDFRLMTVFHMARSMKAGTGYKEGVTAQDLLKTSPQSWAETDLTLKPPVEPNPGKDTMGPIPLGVTVTVRGTAPAPSPSPAPGEESQPPRPPEGRVVALGDADFASNQLLGFQGNRDFFLNSVAWLAQDVDLISIRAKEPEDQRMLLTRTQRVVIGLVSLIVLPGLWVLVGVIVWLVRR